MKGAGATIDTFHGSALQRRTAHALARCSLAAHGLWFLIRDILEDAARRGRLTVGGVPYTVEQIAAYVAQPFAEVAAAFAELEAVGLAACDAMGIHAPMVIRAAELAAIAAANGAHGGRPKKLSKGRTKFDRAIAPAEHNPENNPDQNPEKTQIAPLAVALAREVLPVHVQDLDLDLVRTFDLVPYDPGGGDSKGAGATSTVAKPRNNPDKNPVSKPVSLEAAKLFGAFWAAYPRKVGRKDALKAFVKLAPDAARVDAFVTAIAAHQRSEQWREGFIPHPATWLNGERWTDEIDAAAPEPGRHVAGHGMPRYVEQTWRDRCPHGHSCGTKTQCAGFTSQARGTSFSAELAILDGEAP